MFVMRPGEITPTRDVKAAAVNSFTALLAGLTGRLADPAHVNQVIDDILACSQPAPMLMVEPGTVVIETKKGAK